MTNTMTMTAAAPISQARMARLRKRRRKALRNTLLEALTTMGLLICFLLCGILMLCMV